MSRGVDAELDETVFVKYEVRKVKKTGKLAYTLTIYNMYCR